MRGVIKDARGAPVTGATVVIRGTAIHAVTDVDGEFRIDGRGTEFPVDLVIRFLGYKPAEIRIARAGDAPVEITLEDDTLLLEVAVTARRRRELVQEVPIPVSVVSGVLAEDAGAFNVNRLKELVPTVQLYSSNPPEYRSYHSRAGYDIRAHE